MKFEDIAHVNADNLKQGFYCSLVNLSVIQNCVEKKAISFINQTFRKQN